MAEKAHSANASLDWLWSLPMVLAALLLTSCATMVPVAEEPAGVPVAETGMPAATPLAITTLAESRSPGEETAEAGGAAPVDYYRGGSGKFIKTLPSAPEAPVADGAVTLNFENTNLLKVIKVILGDLLGENYTVEPGVQGSVTLLTSRPLARAALLPTLELLLRSNGAALVLDGGLYRVVTWADAVRTGAVPRLGGAGAPSPEVMGSASSP